VLDHFARSGILIRGYAAAPRQYRFGLPAGEAAWQRLEAACGKLVAQSHLP
jgi:cobalamin biosynthetic protein CobC